MPVIYATLVVNTHNLSKDYSSPEAIAAACSLFDSNLDPTGSESFTINADEGDKVIFFIVARDNKTEISFDSFVEEEKKNSGIAFEPFPTAPHWKGVVKADGAYDIIFKVPSIREEAFTLDPRISVRT